MEFADLIEELENKVQSFDWKENVNQLTVQTLDQQFVDLLAPIIGVDFVAGLDKQHADWLCFSNQFIAKVKASRTPDDELPLVRNQDITMTQFIKTLQLPLRVTVKFLNQTESAFNIFEVDRQLLVAEDNQLIPAQAIYQLRMLGTNSWQ